MEKRQLHLEGIPSWVSVWYWIEPSAPVPDVMAEGGNSYHVEARSSIHVNKVSKIGPVCSEGYVNKYRHRWIDEIRAKVNERYA